MSAAAGRPILSQRTHKLLVFICDVVIAITKQVSLGLRWKPFDISEKMQILIFSVKGT